MTKRPSRTPLDGLPEAARKKLKKRSQPEWTSPMLATLVDEPFSDPDWIYERRLDGERCLAFRKGKTVQLMSRNWRELSATYPEVADALGRQRATDFIVDGEVVAFRGGVTSFEQLQGRMKVRDEVVREEIGELVRRHEIVQRRDLNAVLLEELLEARGRFSRTS